jgi:signal transduction histidine kinase
VEASVSLIRDPKGEPTGFRGILRDITARKAAERATLRAQEDLERRVEERTKELEQANEKLKYEIREREFIQYEALSAKETAEAASRAKSEFLANMSHELRTPLNHIIGFTELVSDHRVGALNETQAEYLDDVLKSGNHLLSLINDILDLSKVEAGKLELKTSHVDLRLLLEESLTMVREKATKHGIHLSLETDGIPESISADERKLKQIVYNLLSNAVKFTPDNGAIRITAAMVDRADPSQNGPGNEQPERGNPESIAPTPFVHVSVTDTGIGLDPEDQKRIFRPFEQVENSASRKYQGTGLGLSLTRRLVELHGGTIWAESEGAGKGSAFCFQIPLANPSGSS